MRNIVLSPSAGFEEWRVQARFCLQENLYPHQILWQTSDKSEQDLFVGQADKNSQNTAKFTISKEFINLAHYAACHSSPERFSLLYRVLWRLCHENKMLLHFKTDNDIVKMNSYIKSVRRDAYKIKAFLRFRESQKEHYVAWYEPEHYSLRLSLAFFQTRFKNMKWSILTPYLAAHWDCDKLILQENPERGRTPESDNIEQYWLKYYATIFNPARPKKAAMLSQMPKKYWKNMPETVLIQDLLRTSDARARKMIEDNE